MDPVNLAATQEAGGAPGMVNSTHTVTAVTVAASKLVAMHMNSKGTLLAGLYRCM